MKRNILLSLALSTIATTAAIADKAKPTNAHVTPDDLTWAQPYGPKGPSFAFVEGTFGDKHPASMFIRFGAGGDSGWHVHDETYSAIVLQGTFTEQQKGEAEERKLPPGSYFTQVGKQAHRNGCLPGAECLVFVHFDKGASSAPTTPDGKLIKMPKAK